jgi:hypothetical protein
MTVSEQTYLQVALEDPGQWELHSSVPSPPGVARPTAATRKQSTPGASSYPAPCQTFASTWTPCSSDRPPLARIERLLLDTGAAFDVR